MNNYRAKYLFTTDDEDQGFTLVEVVFAMIIFLVAVLGIFNLFTYSVIFNAGNNSRSQALSVLQRETENLRSAKFTPSITDAALTGGVKLAKIVISADGNRFIIRTTVDDNPFVAGTQIDNTRTMKEITTTVYLESPTPGWQLSVPATVVLRRVRSN